MNTIHADQPHPAVAATISIGGALFAWLAKAAPALSGLAAIVSVLAGLAAAAWYAVSIYYKLKNKGQTP
jgi:hypothetical protein